MHSENFTYTSSAELESWLDDRSKGMHTSKSILVQIFDGSLDKERVVEITQSIKKYFSNATVIGSSSCGEISDGHVYEDTTLISITSFDTTALEVFSSQESADLSGKEMARHLIKDDTQCIILFVDGLDYEVDTLLESFHEAGGKEITLVGGVSGDNYTFDSSSFVLSDSTIITKGLVAVSLNNTDLHCFNAHNFGWKSIGKDMFITKSDKNCVYEIDGKPSALVYAHYLGEDVLSDLPRSLLEFPLTFDDKGIQVARSVLRVNSDDSIEFSGHIAQGSKVRFAVEDENSVIDTTADIYVKASMQPLESVFVYSCAARKSFFNNHLEAEYKALSQIAPQAGFVTYGEFSYANGSNHLLNVTSVVLGLSESTKIKNHLKTNLHHPKHMRTSAKVVSHLMDVTTQELNEQLSIKHNLTGLLEQYQEALDKASLVSKTDARGIITYSNDKFCELSGYSEAELIGRPHSIVRHSETPSSVFEDMWKKLKAKEVWAGMLQNRKKDGSSYYVHATIFPILDRDGNVYEYMALREDLTSIILYEKALEEQKQRLHQILDNQESIVALTMENGEVSFLNKKFFDAFDYKDIDDFLSRHKCLCELYVDEDGCYKGCEIDCRHDTHDNASSHLIEQEYMIDKKGKILTFRIGTKKIIVDKQTMYISTLTDITEIESARLKAEETKNIKSDFLANMSHEIRTPMNGIIGFAGLLNESVLNEDQRQYVEVIQHSAQMLLGVVNGILDFSKIEQGKMELNVRSINLYKAMELLYMNYLPLTQEKNIRYFLEVDSKINQCLMADELHLKQVLSNLINNAVKFTPEGEKLLIKAILVKDEEARQQVEFSVEDTGVGISPLRQEKIFEAFAQEDTSTTREFGGTGLGLSISSSLVNLMGSKIDLVSQKDEGSRFSFIVTLDKCNMEKRLDTFLKGQEIYLSDNAPDHETVSAYLKDFDISTSVLENNTSKSNSSEVYIVFDEKEALRFHDQLEKEKSLVICIDAQSGLQSEFSNLQVINCYHRCSTRLYNVLSQYGEQLSLEVETTEVFNGSKLRVLVAEDNEVNQILIEELLKKYQISANIVEDGAQAVEAAKQERYDLILMDINMPVLNGVEATKQILQVASKNQFTPIVALTSNVLEEDVMRFKAAGMYAHIGKPINNSDLQSLLVELFEVSAFDEAQEMSNKDMNESLDKAGRLLELPVEIMDSLFEKFLLTTQAIIQKMDEAQKAKDYEALYEQAHKLKGASSSLCFQKITDIAINMEKAVRQKKQLNFSNEIKQLERYLADLKTHKKES